MAMRIPPTDNPYAVGVAVGRPSGHATLNSVPVSRFDAQHMAKTLDTTNSQLQAAYQKWQQEVDEVRVKDFMGRLEEKRLDLRNNPESGYVNLLGENALNRPSGKSLNEEVREEYKKCYEELRGKAGNARQRRALDAYYQNSDVDLSNDLNQHVFRQQMKYKDAVLENNLNIAVRQAQDDDPKTSASGLEAARGIAKEISEFHGVPVDLVKIMGPIHSAKISNLIDSGRLSQAREYIRANQAEIGSADRKRLNRAMQIASESGFSDSESQKIFDKANGSWFEALKMIRAIPEGKKRNAVERKVKRLFNDKAEYEKAERGDYLEKGMQFALRGADIPASMVAELEEKGYTDVAAKLEKVKHAVQFPIEQDNEDRDRLSELQTEAIIHPEKFAERKLDEERDRLSEKTIISLKKQQAAIPSQQFRQIQKMTNDRCISEQIPTKDRPSVQAVVMELYLESKKAKPGGTMSVSDMEGIVNTAFSGEKKGWLFGWNKTTLYKVKQDNPTLSVRELEAQGKWKQESLGAEERKEATEAINEIRRSLGLDYSLSAYTPRMLDLYSRIKNGLPPDRDLWQKAKETVNKQAEEARASGREAEVTNQKILRMYQYLAFGDHGNGKR